MATEKVPSLRRPTIKTVSYIVILALTLVILSLIFNYIIASFNLPITYWDYHRYVQAAIVLGLGYLAVGSASQVIYLYMRKVADHPTAAALRTIGKIAGLAVLVSVLASVFNVSPAAALTVGSFTGLVVGFATQSVLSHMVAGIFLVILRPFKHGDVITVAGQTGSVKDIRIMHTILTTTDGSKEILIPSGSIVGAIVVKTLKIEKME